MSPTWWNAAPGELRSDHDHEGPRVVGYCRRCSGPYFTYENTISHLCDPCLDADHDEARREREQAKAASPDS